MKANNPKGPTVDYCRIVITRQSDGMHCFYRWMPAAAEGELLALTDRYRDLKLFQVSVQYREPLFATPAATQEHIPVSGPTWPGKIVYRYTFPDGSTGDLDALTVEREERKQLASILQWEREGRQQEKATAGRKSGQKRREKLGLDQRDEEIGRVAAEERAEKVHGYIKRTAKRFPDVKYERIKQIIEKN